jgi:hypothetical protein
MQYVSIMARILERLSWPQKKTVHHSDLKAMELEAAREILAEVFRVKLSEVDEMIENRFQAGLKGSPNEADSLWPQELWVEGCGQLHSGGSSLSLVS